MNKKQALIKGFEIGIKCKDNISGQLDLANQMAETTEDANLCTDCKKGDQNGCMQNPMYTTQTKGMSNMIVQCDKFKT